MQPRTAPFLKWAGGKRQLLPQLLSRVPDKFDRYFEPFLGGGALLLAVGPSRAVANDANTELVRCFTAVRDHPEAVIDELRSYENTEDCFYAARAVDPSTLNDVGVAARMVFLNRTCFNGLYRVNRQGRFNTPYGRYKSPNLLPEELLRAASLTLQGVELRCGDYREGTAGAREGDFIYLDPPYVPVSEYSDFRRYSAVQFRDQHHEELALHFKELDTRGCRVMLSNSSAPRVFELYSDWNISEVSARRNINSKGSRRGAVTELVITNF